MYDAGRFMQSCCRTLARQGPLMGTSTKRLMLGGSTEGNAWLPAWSARLSRTSSP